MTAAPAPKFIEDLVVQLGDKGVGVIRTAVQTGIGFLIAWAASHGVVVDEVTKAGLVAGIVPVATLVWRTGINYLQLHVNVWFGFLNGVPALPKYQPPQDPGAGPGEDIA